MRVRRDLRTVPRYFLLEPLVGEAGGQRARYVDISVKGARIEVERPLIAGSLVNLSVADVHVHGTVLWCQIDNLSAHGDRYLAGLCFEQNPGVEALLDDLCGREAAMRIVDTRNADRYILSAPITGSFGEVGPISIVDLSIRGARISTSDPLDVGQVGMLRFQVDAETGPIAVDGKVAWSRRIAGLPGHHAGLAIENEEEQLRAAIHVLCVRDEARIDLFTLRRKFESLRGGKSGGETTA